MAWYTIVVIDQDDTYLSNTEESSLKQAKASALDKFREFAHSGAKKVEVRAQSGKAGDICVWDKFFPRAAADSIPGGTGLEQSPSGLGDGPGDSGITPGGAGGGRAPGNPI